MFTKSVVALLFAAAISLGFADTVKAQPLYWNWQYYDGSKNVWPWPYYYPSYQGWRYHGNAQGWDHSCFRAPWLPSMYACSHN